MFGFFKRNNSSKKAKQRLKAVISRDRANVSSEFILRMTADIINIALKYIEPDYDNISITVERDKTNSYLCAKLPILAYKQLTT